MVVAVPAILFADLPHSCVCPQRVRGVSEKQKIVEIDIGKECDLAY